MLLARTQLIFYQRLSFHVRIHPKLHTLVITPLADVVCEIKSRKKKVSRLRRQLQKENLTKY